MFNLWLQFKYDRYFIIVKIIKRLGSEVKYFFFKYMINFYFKSELNYQI